MKNKIIIIAITLIVIFVALELNVFRLFVSKRLDLADTTITIAEVKEIAKLHVAKYYGEVIHSLSEALCDDEANKIYTFFESINKDLNLPATETEVNNNDSRLASHFNRAFPDNAENKSMMNQMKQAYLNVDRRNQNLAEKKFSRLNNSQKRSYKVALLKFIKDNTKVAYIALFHDDIIELIRDKLKIKERIAYLARGKVVASIDLSKLASGDYSVDNNGILTIKTSLNIDCIINPLFVYGRSPSGSTVKFHGYQVIKNSKKVTKSKTFSKVQRVKLGCRLKLIKYAINDKLLEKAINTAQDKLFAFISLFKTLKSGNNEKREIKAVKVILQSITSSSPKINQWFAFNSALIG
jgi:hypothetical protein